MKIFKKVIRKVICKKVVQTDNLQKVIRNSNFQKKIDQEDKCGTRVVYLVSFRDIFLSQRVVFSALPGVLFQLSDRVSSMMQQW